MKVFDHKSWAAPAVLCLSLSACGSGETVPSCDYLSGNLISDNAFDTIHAGRAERKWHISEHAAGKSFDFSVANGEMSIEKTGIEPWTVITQSVDSKPLAGKVVEFSAELKMDLRTAEPEHGFTQGAGLTFLAREGNKPVVRSTLDHDPRMGQHDWHQARLVFKLPRKLSYLQVGFIHQASGTIEIRNPSLREVAPDCETTVIGKPTK